MAAVEDDDSWLYGAGGGGATENNDGKLQDNDDPRELEENIPSESDVPRIELETVDDGGVASEGEVENGDMRDDTDNFDRNDASENKLDIEEGIIDEEILDDGATGVLDESLADGEAGSQEDAGSDDDDSDDDVQVTIGDIKAIPSYGYGSTPVNLNIKRVAGFGSAGVASTATKTKGLDIDAVGNVNGVPLYDFNLDTMEDKPWRKPGADITDYFNYGFNEDSWKIYCERQRKLRLENNVSGKVSVNHVTGLKDQLIPVASVNENSKYSAAVAINLGLKKAGPPPGRKLSGSIDVIGGGAPSLPSRRPVSTTKENVITVMTGRKFDAPPPGIPPPHLAPTHLPPPSFLTGVPPETNLSIPPPPIGTILPPTNIPPPPPGTPFPDHFASGRYSVPPPPVVGAPMSGYEDHNAYYNGSNISHGGTYDETTQQSWPSSTRARSEGHRDREHRERSREREHERSYTTWDYREHETRERERGMSSRGSVVGEEEYGRSRHREYHERSRDRERDRERSTGGYEREYERDDRYERDRERRHKEHRSDREERHRERSSRRRHHHEHHESDEDYEHRASRHKHKRSKREKDEETSSNAPPSASESQDATELDIKQE